MQKENGMERRLIQVAKGNAQDQEVGRPSTRWFDTIHDGIRSTDV